MKIFFKIITIPYLRSRVRKKEKIKEEKKDGTEIRLLSAKTCTKEKSSNLNTARGKAKLF